MIHSEKKDCEINNCPLRHPRECRFFSQYARCKFGEYCFFRHKTSKSYEELESDFRNIEKNMIEMNEIIRKQEQIIEVLKCSIDDNVRETETLQVKVHDIQKEKNFVDVLPTLVSAQCNEIEKNLIEVCQTMITESAKAISMALTQNQVTYEQKNLNRLDALHNQLSAVSSLFKPPKQPPNS